MKIALACDHSGYEALQDIKIFLQSLGHETKNFGPVSLNPSDDYPDFILPAAKAVASGECQKGIIIGGSGQGEAMSANRINGVRCAVFYATAVPRRAVDVEGNTSHDPYEIIKLSRLHNDANMLSLAARFLSNNEIHQAIKVWLETDFSGNTHHARRNAKLDREAG